MRARAGRATLTSLRRAWPFHPCRRPQVYVPAAPSDCGLAVGSGWLVAPPQPRPSSESERAGGRASPSARVAVSAAAEEEGLRPLERRGSALRDTAAAAAADRLQHAGWPLFDAEDVDR